MEIELKKKDEELEKLRNMLKAKDSDLKRILERKKESSSNCTKHQDFSVSLNTKSNMLKESNDMMNRSYKGQSSLNIENKSASGETNIRREKHDVSKGFDSNEAKRQGNLSSILSGIDKNKAKQIGENLKMSNSRMEKSYEIEKEFKESNILKAYKKKIDDKREEVNINKT
jgi:hypothetical protein